MKRHPWGSKMFYSDKHCLRSRLVAWVPMMSDRGGWTFGAWL